MTAQEAREWLLQKDPEMPVFVLLGSDPHAGEAVLTWATEASLGNVRNEKIAGALDVLQAMHTYQPKKKPD